MSTWCLTFIGTQHMSPSTAGDGVNLPTPGNDFWALPRVPAPLRPGACFRWTHPPRYDRFGSCWMMFSSIQRCSLALSGLIYTRMNKECLFFIMCFTWLSSSMVGHKGQLAPRCRALDAMITNLYNGIQNAVHPFIFKNFEHLLLGSGGTTILNPAVGGAC